MTQKVTRLKKTDTDTPNSLRKAEALLQKIGKTQDSINETTGELNRKIAELKAEAEAKLVSLTTLQDRQVNALFAYADPRKEELLEDKRSVKLSTGVFGWRMTTPRVETKLSDEQVIELLKKSDNEHLVRVREEVDRQGLLAERPLLLGVEYTQHDEFYVTPKPVKAKKKKTLTRAIDR